MFEIHITVDTTDIKKFVDDCISLNVKPIVIDTGYNQVMTSSKYKDDNYSVILALTHNLIKLGYNVVRQKIEIFPKETKNESFIYYESHIRVIVQDNQIESLRSIANKHNFHVSRNLFKKLDTFSYIMITYRSVENLSDFLSEINKMKSVLDDNSFQYDKIEIEECIFDTNQSIDVKWLSNSK